MAATSKKKCPKRSILWKDDFYVKIYTLARSGLSDRKIAQALGVSNPTFVSWREKRPALVRALKQARGEKAKNFQASFRQYVYRQLSPELQEVWDKINACEDEPSGVAQLEALLSNQGKAARQHLFLYALVDCNFNPSEACRKVNISRDALNYWVKTDPGFSQIMDQMHLHKGDFFEEGLVRLVKEGDSKAIIFANRTYNGDRGYNEKLQVQHSGQVNHLHVSVEIDDLNLPLEIRTEVLKALRQKKELEETNSQTVLEAQVIEQAEDEDDEEVY